MAVRHKRMPHIQVCPVIADCRTKLCVARASCVLETSMRLKLQEQCSYAGS
jgi:hypothetical protein